MTEEQCNSEIEGKPQGLDEANASAALELSDDDLAQAAGGSGTADATAYERPLFPRINSNENYTPPL